MRTPINSPSFTRWFGDSRIVDSQGDPLRVFHGTQSEFSQFDRSRLGANVPNNPTTRMGFFFTADPDGATRWATYHRNLTRALGTSQPNVMPVYLRIENPYEFDAQSFQYLLRRATAKTVDRIVAQATSAGHDGFVIDYRTTEPSSADGDGQSEKWFVALRPAQIKSALGNNGAFSLEDPDIRFSRGVASATAKGAKNRFTAVDRSQILAGATPAQESRWRSVLTDQVRGSSMRTGTPAAWLDLIRGWMAKGRVKPAEVNASGLLAWLSSQQAGGVERLSADRLLGHMADHSPRLEEASLTPLGGPTKPHGIAEGVADGKARFEQYVAGPSSGYREILLKLASRPGTPSSADEVLAKWKARYPHWNAGQRVESVMTADDLIAFQAELDAQASNFESGHWPGHTNVLVHIRLSDRLTPRGRKVLFVEEIQSDWAQMGRRRGFRLQDPAPTDLVATPWGDVEGVFEVRDGNGRFITNVTSDDGATTADTAVAIAHKRLQAGALGTSDSMRPPSGPFVDTTEGWLSLALRRIVAEAADGGYDQVAFVTGDQSVRMFGLRREIKSVRWAKSESQDGADMRDEARFDITIQSVPTDDGLSVEHDEREVELSAVSLDRLDEELGPDIATEIRKRIQINGHTRGQLNGMGLLHGGEGLKAFYDQVLPEVLKRTMRRFQTSAQRSFLTSEADEAANNSVAWREYEAEFDELSERQQDRVRFLAAREVTSDGVFHWGFEMTPDLRDRVSQGVPLFNRGGAVRFEVEANPAPHQRPQRMAARPTLDALNAMVKRVARALPNAPDIRVVGDWLQAPEDLRQAIAAAGALHEVRGCLHSDGRIYLIANNLHTLAQAEHVLIEHEVAHAGLAALLGKKRGHHLRRLAEMNPELEQQAKAVSQSQRISLEAAVEEVLVDMPTADLPTLKGWRGFVQALADGCRELGLDRTSRLLTRWIDRGTDSASLAAALGGRLVLAARLHAQGARRARGLAQDAAARLAEAASKATETPPPTFTWPASVFSRLLPKLAVESNFQRWFADSKVVDAEGKPLVVYHGTARIFSKFDPQRVGSNWGRVGGDTFGIFFTTSTREAEHNARHSARRGGAPHLMPVYLSIKNPLKVKARYGQNATNDFDTYKREYRQQMLDGGHDGIVVEDGSELLLVALRPEQIKSAIGNNGAFDPTNPDIRFSRGIATAAPPGELDQAIKSKMQMLVSCTAPIEMAHARLLVAGCTRQGGVDPATWLSDSQTSTVRVGKVPLDEIAPNEAGDRYDGTVSGSLAREYAARPGQESPPVILRLSQRSGVLRVIDGGHRVTAARQRGDQSLNALVLVDRRVIDIARNTYLSAPGGKASVPVPLHLASTFPFLNLMASKAFISHPVNTNKTLNGSPSGQNTEPATTPDPQAHANRMARLLLLTRSAWDLPPLSARPSTGERSQRTHQHPCTREAASGA